MVVGRQVNPRAARSILQRLHALVQANSDFSARYEEAKRVVRVFRKPAFYEITQRCNLKCEGCYYFEGGITNHVPEEASLRAWEDFFAAEAQRKITMAYFVGAEPALHQERLIAAAPYFPHGNIGTNGTIRIDPAIPYRIGVSVWAGNDSTDRELRGGAAFRKAFRNYAGDRRVIVLYTLSPWNLSEARTVAQMCRDHGLPLTFNMYSPTGNFLNKLRRESANDNEFFRVSRPGYTPCFSDEDLGRTRRVVADLMDDFRDTIVYSRAYNDWATGRGSRYDVDENGIAKRCGSQMVGNMSYYGTDLRQMQPKCATPDINCSECRMYSGGWSSRFQPDEADIASERAFSDWLDMMQVLGRIFLYDRTAHDIGATQKSPALAAAE
jgi:hypothetical protein